MPRVMAMSTMAKAPKSSNANAIAAVGITTLGLAVYTASSQFAEAKSGVDMAAVKAEILKVFEANGTGFKHGGGGHKNMFAVL